MGLTLNSAGGSAADPVLKGLGIRVNFEPQSMDVANVDDIWLDEATGFPGTNSISGSVSPATTVIEKGTSGAWTQSNKNLDIGSTTGLSAGDYIYLSHSSITDGFYAIDTVVDADTVSLVSEIYGSDLTSISYQVGWIWETNTGAAGWFSNSDGDQNFLKFQADDGLNDTQEEDSIWVREAPSGSDYIALESGSYTGNTISKAAANGYVSISLDVLSGWTNEGGISHVELANHSVQGTNEFYWDSSLTDQSEKALATAESGGLYFSTADPPKTVYSALKLKSKASAAVTVDVDMDLGWDITGPTLEITVNAR